MRLEIFENPSALGRGASHLAASVVNSAIVKNGEARIVLSTGMSQFETLASLVKEDVDWRRVIVFHLDEYKGISISHKASFRKYLDERFVSLVPLKAFFPVEGDINELSGKLREKPVDLGLIGIGENAHIAFNDPPCNFETEDEYITVTLNEACRRQQVREGWFESVNEVPPQAVSMSCCQIMKCRTIISAVPHAVKAEAVRAVLYTDKVTPEIPASILKTHPDWTLCLDRGSASELEFDRIRYFS